MRTSRITYTHSCLWLTVLSVTFLHITWLMVVNVNTIKSLSKNEMQRWLSNTSLYQPSYIISKEKHAQYSRTIKASDLRVYRDFIHEMYIRFHLPKNILSPIVHFDLGKDPVKTNYLRKVFAHLNYFGAKAVMLQYDDSFPFSGQLSKLRSPYSYDIDDINTILTGASKSKLEVIPYVQVIGQMEYLLQHDEYDDIRSDSFPKQTICPCSNRGVSVVKEIILQVMAIHKHAKAIHIGGDDFYNSRSICRRCKGKNSDEDKIYVDYIRTICIFIKRHYPQINIMIWDNRLRRIPINKLKFLKNLIEPMALDFQPDVSNIINGPHWKTYKSLFHQVWVAAAYKGAEECDDNFVPVVSRLSNIVSWGRALHGLKIAGNKVGGITLMGFSRPAYSLPTCQLLPASIPSVLLMVLAIKVNAYHKYINSEVAICTLRCKDFFHVELTEDYAIEACDRMPGRQSYRLLSVLRVLKSRISNLLTTVGKNRYLLADQFYQVLLIDELIYLQGALKSLNNEVQLSFNEIYHNHTIEEWRYHYLRPLINLVNDFHWHMLNTQIIVQS